jgi:hypothetical protein
MTKICSFVIFYFNIFQQKLKRMEGGNHCDENSKTESVEYPIKSKLVKLCTSSLENRKKNNNKFSSISTITDVQKIPVAFEF